MSSGPAELVVENGFACGDAVLLNGRGQRLAGRPNRRSSCRKRRRGIISTLTHCGSVDFHFLTRTFVGEMHSLRVRLKIKVMNLWKVRIVFFILKRGWDDLNRLFYETYKKKQFVVNKTKLSIFFIFVAHSYHIYVKYMYCL